MEGYSFFPVSRSQRTQGLDVWGNDLDAFLASYEDLIYGGRGVWYTRGSPLDDLECTHEDGIEARDGDYEGD